MGRGDHTLGAQQADRLEQQRGGGLKTSGQVTFNELSPSETEITVTLQYVPPAGMAGELVAELFSDPRHQLEEDLRNFKAQAEGRLPAARQEATR